MSRSPSVRCLRLLCAAMIAVAGLSLATDHASGANPDFKPGPMLQEMLDGPMREVDEIVFATRVPGRDHWYVTFGNYSNRLQSPAQQLGFKDEDGVFWGYGEGGRLCRMNLRTGDLTLLIDDATGGVRDPQVHYDGQKILFSYRPGGTHTFHLYEINIDGSGLTQLTDGPDDDIEATYCPDGSIVFCSSRCRRVVNCWHTRVATLYRCDADGENIRMLSPNCDHDNTPWVLPDGRVLYMRWEYVDRSQVHFHHLWSMNPDGTNQTVYFGNMHGGIAMLDAKPIPGTLKVVASFSPGHGRPEHLGNVAIVDPNQGPDVREAAHHVSRESFWKDPYAISEDCFLVAQRRGLYVMNGQGKNEMIYELPEGDRFMECHEPRVLQSRKRERIIPDRTRLGQANGQLVLEDVYAGRKMDSVERGSIKKLLVLHQIPKPVNFSGGMEPLTIGGTFTMAQILGTVPVEEDGSASFEVPALRPTFFVALDADDKPVKRMHSFVVLQPGETLSCVGCHDNRIQAPHEVASTLAALNRPASQIERIPGIPDVMDFPRDIQPILDAHCVECHSPDRFDGKVDLTGDKTAMYTMSYWAMQSLVSDGRNRITSNYEPYAVGSAASPLMKYLDGSHHDAELSDQEVTLVRLWIESSATYPGTYASLGCGTYSAVMPWTGISNRCAECHVKTRPDGKGGTQKVVRFGRSTSTHRGTSYNISRPEKSFILLAPLAKEAGGLQLCGEPVFENKDDPLYKAILAAAEDAHRRLMVDKRFDMPGFRPNDDYIREMQRFEILPSDLGPDDPVDPYATDRAYWDSFHYQPQAGLVEGPTGH